MHPEEIPTSVHTTNDMELKHGLGIGDFWQSTEGRIAASGHATWICLSAHRHPYQHRERIQWAEWSKDDFGRGSLQLHRLNACQSGPSPGIRDAERAQQAPLTLIPGRNAVSFTFQPPLIDSESSNGYEKTRTDPTDTHGTISTASEAIVRGTCQSRPRRRSHVLPRSIVQSSTEFTSASFTSFEPRGPSV